MPCQRRNSKLQGRRTYVGDGEVVCGVGGTLHDVVVGAGGVEGAACEGREGGDVRAHAGAVGEPAAETCRRAGRRCWPQALCEYNTMYMAGLEVEAAFDVARGGGRHSNMDGVRVDVVAALMEEMSHVRGIACFINCEAKFRYSKCVRQGCVVAPVLWR